ncbi:MAG TPA: hypothetical protein VF815_10610 [Myxococcaceae bacterium]
MNVISKVRKPEALAASQQWAELLPWSARHVGLSQYLLCGDLPKV